MNPQQALSQKFQGIPLAIISKNILVKNAKINRELFGAPDTESNVLALWDTGSSTSCISNKLAHDLALQKIGMVKVRNFGGTHDARKFKIDLNINNQVNIEDMDVIEFIKEDAPFDIILGMDLICIGDMCISNANKQTLFSFRVPSSEKPIDFVQEIKVKNKPKEDIKRKIEDQARIRKFQRPHAPKHR